jgi:hypothetical protein
LTALAAQRAPATTRGIGVLNVAAALRNDK